MHIGKATAIFRSFDEKSARAFYVGFLGFKVDWEHRVEPDTPLYMQVSRDDFVLHLSEHHGDAKPGSATRIEVDDVDAFQTELATRRYANQRPGGPQDQSWGARELILTDPFGNRLVFFSQLPR